MLNTEKEQLQQRVKNVLGDYYNERQLKTLSASRPDKIDQQAEERLLKALRPMDIDCPLLSLKEIDALYNALIQEDTQTYTVSNPYLILQGANVTPLVVSELCKNAVQVLCSQGNMLEGMSPEKIDYPSNYKSDRTQGPQALLKTMHIAYLRTAKRKDIDVMGEWLKSFDQTNDQTDQTNDQTKNFIYKHGYCVSKKGKEQVCLELVQNHISELKLNVQPVPVFNEDNEPFQHFTQIPLFSWAYGYQDSNGELKDYEVKDDGVEQKEAHNSLTLELLKNQYEFSAKVAVIKSLLYPSEEPFNLILSPVGGGVFKNDQGKIAEAMSGIENIVKGHNIRVIFSAFSQDELTHYKTSIMGFKDAPVVDFKRKTNPRYFDEVKSAMNTLSGLINQEKFGNQKISYKDLNKEFIRQNARGIQSNESTEPRVIGNNNPPLISPFLALKSPSSNASDTIDAPPGDSPEKDKSPTNWRYRAGQAIALAVNLLFLWLPVLIYRLATSRNHDKQELSTSDFPHRDHTTSNISQNVPTLGKTKSSPFLNGLKSIFEKRSSKEQDYKKEHTSSLHY